MYIHISSYCVGVVKSGSPNHHIKSMAPVQPQEECRNISWIFGLCEAALGLRFKFPIPGGNNLQPGWPETLPHVVVQFFLCSINI